MKTFILLLLCCLLSCTPSKQTLSNDLSLESIGLSKSAMNQAVNPCDDFYEFACGNWLNQTEIPEDRSRWGRSFSEIGNRNELLLKQLLETPPSMSPVSKAIHRYYNACMDETSIERANISGIVPLLDIINSVKSKSDITKALATLHRYGIPVLFTVDSEQDFKDTKITIAYLSQKGLGLPNRDYYLDSQFKDIRNKYKKHLKNMFLLGKMPLKNTTQAASNVLSIEKNLAKISKTAVELRDPHGVYNRIDRQGLPTIISMINWDIYFSTLGFPNIQMISIDAPNYFKGLNKLFTSYSVTAWKHYMKWHLFHSTASSLPKRFAEETFRLQTIISGQPKMRVRWKQCVSATIGAMPDYVGKIFVDEVFSKQAKQNVIDMIHAIGESFSEHIKSYAWMDDATKNAALAKQELLEFLIGYPDQWQSNAFSINPNNYVASTLSARRFYLEQSLNKVGKPTNRNEWVMSPAIVNAYYHPLKNHMVYPAGILQSPLYTNGAPFAVNMGGIGMIIGHELIHAFDDSGAQFDGYGALNNWWNKKVSQRFKKKTQCVAKQYSAYEVLPHANINGQLTLGENIADIAGVKLAYDAYQDLKESTNTVEGLTQDQLFFLSVGQSWCTKTRPKQALKYLKVDPHSPPRYRVNGSLSNLPAFGEAFSCEIGSPMRPTNICTVW